ncbi:hypothetical protein [Paraburkholderia gardini]|uniref:hypothetical protein n=1 Tax=Paraburkholderia gardini TaxID=2823469 RepID=UPI001D68817D|nr:hypothetical protein [Paraburkholderia gardini]CAG4923298.1 hypothetical protein R69919_05088 [Paraburkholderia gardini]
MDKTFAQTMADLRMLLRDHPPLPTTDVTDGAAVYVDHGTLWGVFLSADEPDGLDAPFVVDAWFTGHVAENLADWFNAPRFTYRPALAQWVLDAPPVEAAD